MAGDLETILRPTQARLHDSYVARREDWRRPHLGGSVLGHKCERYLWLVFRWAGAPKFNEDGRMLRLLERGNREEVWIVQDLRDIGIEVHDVDENGDQICVRWGHIQGHLDGTVLGLFEAPKTKHLLEIKTTNLKGFARLVDKGVKRAKPEHYTQVQVYMHGAGLKRAFYVAVCKDNDEIYTERISYDQEFAEKQLARGQRVIAMREPPPIMNPDYPPCKYTSKDGTEWPCDFYDQCHGEALPAKNCRTCISSSPMSDGTWRCDQIPGIEVGEGFQKIEVHPCHLTIPPMINRQAVEVNEDRREITYVSADGTTFTDGKTDDRKDD